MTHTLKTLTPYFQAAWIGDKTFEIRANDRKFKERDEVVLEEMDGSEYTGRRIEGFIRYMTDFEQKPGWYNPYTDCLDVQRGKTGEVGSIPVTDRCRAIILSALQEKRKRVLDWTNHQKEYEKCRKKSGVYFWFGRDLRTTFGNRIFKITKSDQAASKAMLHRDPRTFINHYKVDHAEDLRPAIKTIENSFK